MNSEILLVHVYLSLAIGAIVAAWAAQQITKEAKIHLKEVQKVKKKFKYEKKFEKETEVFALGFGFSKGRIKGELDFALFLGRWMLTIEKKVVYYA